MKKSFKKILSKLKPKSVKHAVLIGSAVPLVVGSITSAQIFVKGKEVSKLNSAIVQKQAELNRIRKYNRIAEQRIAENLLKGIRFEEKRKLMLNEGLIPRIQFKSWADYEAQTNPVIDWVPIPSAKGLHKFEPKPTGKRTEPVFDSLNQLEFISGKKKGSSFRAVRVNSPNIRKTIAKRRV
jgi:hypothetical protein